MLPDDADSVCRVKYGLIVLKDKKVRQRICFDEKSPRENI